MRANIFYYKLLDLMISSLVTNMQAYLYIRIIDEINLGEQLYKINLDRAQIV